MKIGDELGVSRDDGRWSAAFADSACAPRPRPPAPPTAIAPCAARSSTVLMFHLFEQLQGAVVMFHSFELQGAVVMFHSFEQLQGAVVMFHSFELQGVELQTSLGW